jgi:hypothetical protein
MPTATIVTASNEPLRIQKLLVIPNPLYSGNAVIAFNLQGTATHVTMRVYTLGYDLMQKQDYDISEGPGWVTLPVDANKWRNGLLFLRVMARNGAGSTSKITSVYVKK